MDIRRRLRRLAFFVFLFALAVSTASIEALDRLNRAATEAHQAHALAENLVAVASQAERRAAAASGAAAPIATWSNPALRDASKAEAQEANAALFLAFVAVVSPLLLAGATLLLLDSLAREATRLAHPDADQLATWV